MRLPGVCRGGLVAVALVVVVGCANGSPSASAAGPAAGSTSASPEATAAISPSLPSSVPGVDVVMDPALLQILPAAIGAAKVEIEPESFTEAVRDSSFVASVDGAAFAIVVEGEDWATGVVAHLRSGVFSEGFFRDWRDTFDEGACGQAGGVAGHAEVGLEDDRTTYVMTCAGGLRVYHAYVAEREVVVSLFSLGERRFGEQLMSGLRP
jgi:hypothetical protein